MGVECELGHACPREPQGPGERQKLLRFLTQSLARPGSLCDVPRVTGGQAGGGARGRTGGRAQGRVAAGRAGIPTDKRGSLSRRHKAAGRALGLGRLRGSAGRGVGGAPRGQRPRPRRPRRPPGPPGPPAPRDAPSRRARSRAGTR